MQVHPNMTIVTEAMTLSFEMRRNDIVTTMEQILGEYPFLGNNDQVRHIN